jgi:hypothetical protein
MVRFSIFTSIYHVDKEIRPFADMANPSAKKGSQSRGGKR